MKTKEDALKIVELLESEYPDAMCSLDFGKDYELLFSVRLAAQCTDERVNKITPALFEAYPCLLYTSLCERSCDFPVKYVALARFKRVPKIRLIKKCYLH